MISSRHCPPCKLSTLSLPGCDRFCRDRGSAFASPDLWLIRKVDELVSPFSPPHYCSRLEARQAVEDLLYVPRSVEFGNSSSHHVLSILTAPRPVEDELPRLLDSLHKAGVDRWSGVKLIVADGSSPAVPSGWQGHFLPAPSSGSARAFRHVLQSAIKADPELEYLTYLEDDVVLSANALDYISSVQVPDDLSLVSWFTYDYNPPTLPLGPEVLRYKLPVLACRPTRLFILNQFLTIPRRTIEAVLRCPYVRDWPKSNGSDEIFGWVLGDVPYAVHFPNLAQHGGGTVNSAVLLTMKTSEPDRSPHPDYFTSARISPFFAGVDFDSLSLRTR